MKEGTMFMEINLNEPRILSSSEACYLWGIHDSLLRKKAHSFPKGTIRRFGTSWVVTEKGMIDVFGKRKNGLEPIELKRMIDQAKKEMEQNQKSNDDLSDTQLTKNVIQLLLDKGVHSIVAHSVLKVILGQMEEELLFSLFKKCE